MNIIKIGDTQLKLKTKDKKYIITYVNEYDEQLDTLLDTIFNELSQYYRNGGLNYDKVCDANAKFICQNLKIEKILTIGKIIITDWIRPIKEEYINNIRTVYGSTTLRIGGAAYHALAYLEVFIDENIYYVAIESTVSKPFKIQFFVGTNETVVGKNETEFESLIKTCFQCKSFKISFECDKLWYMIAYQKAGKRKSRRNRKSKKGKKSRKARKSRRKSNRRSGRR
jgi:hypothetical protein